MGRDFQPKIRQQEKLLRKIAQREPYPRILIVSEGSETEPNYFQEIREFYKLSSTNIKIIPSYLGTNPTKIVEYAKSQCLETKEWEEIYCVFDRDDFTDFEQALQQIKDLDGKHKNENKEKIKFKAIPSYPCFEIWLLIHIQCLTTEIHRNDLQKLLKKKALFKNYKKGEAGLFKKTKDFLEQAKKNADILRQESNKNENKNPSTEVDQLVKRLIGLKSHVI